jgi:hypothetical protein
MAVLKTRMNRSSVKGFLASVRDPRMRADSLRLLSLMKRATGERARMWGDSIVGFGVRRYRYASGREVDWFLAGFSPRKRNLTVYLMGGLDGRREFLKRLGRHTTGRGCISFKCLGDIDASILGRLVTESVRSVKKQGL